MVTKYVFNLRSEERRRELPAKIIIVQSADEDERVVLQRLFGYLILFRDRIQMQTDLRDDYIPFVPDLVQLDYQLQPAFWAECGECDTKKLNKLAVKIHEGEVWIVRSSREARDELTRRMSKAGLRRSRYHILTLDQEMVDEVQAELQARNDVTWYLGHFDPPAVQFEFNGIWFESEFEVTEF
jgi:uncharacterized protein YaeQ